MKMNPVVHFEMPYKDAKRLSRFYSNVFGWNMLYLPKMGSYVLATTSPLDKKGMHKKKGAINGGFYPITKDDKIPHLVISVDNLEKHMEIVKMSLEDALQCVKKSIITETPTALTIMLAYDYIRMH